MQNEADAVLRPRNDGRPHLAFAGPRGDAGVSTVRRGGGLAAAQKSLSANAQQPSPRQHHEGVPYTANDQREERADD